MKVCATVAEFNLFHGGHERLFKAISAGVGEDTVKLVFMSGNFVQRGEPAILDKYTRAEMAVRCGSDLVLELPFPWSCSGAEFFASGAVALLSDIARAAPEHEYTLCFGSESGDIRASLKTAENLSSKEYLEKIAAERLKKSDRSESDIRMRNRIYKEQFGEPLPRTPNDILGVEYLRALAKEKGCSVTPYTVRREGTESATRSREFYRSGDMQKLAGICPEPVLEAVTGRQPVTAEDIYPMIASWLLLSRDLPSDDTDGMTHDLIYRFASAAKECSGFDDLIRTVGTKKYTDARLRRALLLGFFGIKTEELRQRPSYTVVLGASTKGRSLLASLRRAEGGPKIITAPSELDKTDGADPLIRADGMYAIASGDVPGAFMLRHPFILS